MFLPETEDFKTLLDAAFAEWAPGAKVSYKRLRGGRSGAVVLKVDIRGEHDGDLDNGQYILKLSRHSKWLDQDSEIVAHRRATDRNTTFATQHIPNLVKAFDLAAEDVESGGYAILFEIAGASMDAYMAAEGRDIPGFLDISEKLSKDLLYAWTEGEPSEDRRPHELIESWCGYRLNPAEAPALHTFVAARMRDDMVFVAAGEVLLNPLSFYQLAKEKQWPERSCLGALLHGDLHGGNILIPRTNHEKQPYWVIDFGLSNAGFAGYDQAYLEVSQIIYWLGNADPAHLIGLLKDLDAPGSKQFLPPGIYWLKDCLRTMRNAFATWRQKVHQRRNDDIIRQFLLARVAAGVNWANKAIDRSEQTLSIHERFIALCYAGWAAREYVRNFEPEDWQAISSSMPVGAAKETAVTVTPSADDSLWQELWTLVGGFSQKAGKFILVSEAQGDHPSLKTLGQLPWSAVIDLDPYSDTSGLHRNASPILQTYRGLHTFSDSFPVTDFSRGTAWMMAAGWDVKREDPTAYENWLWDKLPLIRDFVKRLEEQVNPNPVYVIILPGASLDTTAPLARVGKIVSAIYETMRGRATTVLLGRNQLPETVSYHHIPMDAETFIARVEQTFGASAHRSTAQIPAADGEWRSIPIDSLRTMQENFLVLHSGILEEVANDETADRPNTFWRGHPPTWVDFNLRYDIDRQINSDLVNTLREELEGYRNHTVLLNHTPGSGGTTAARRAAWELHNEYPVAILTKWSTALPIRVENLYRIAQKPVLLVAEASELKESAREDLYRELAQSNVRTILLYVRRVFRADHSQGLKVSDPMDQEEEARDFYRAYSLLTTDERRRKELRRITDDKELIQYRSPFFYGLITYEDEFLPIDTYVASHILGVRGKVREIMEYLAFVTIYSDTGIHEILLRRLIGIKGDNKFSLAEVLGDGPARLITNRQGTLRLMHQVIAEQVLKHTIGGGKDDWRGELHQIATEFIRDVATSINPHSQITLELFRQLFIDRFGSSIDGIEDRKNFSPLIEEIDAVSKRLGHGVLTSLTEYCPKGDHFWSHLGRHQIYRLASDPEKAEEYLRRAIALSPDDYIHYHTLGLVERYRVREVLRDFKGRTASEILTAVASHFQSAVTAFEKSREINAENIYAHITHVQMILEVAERLKRSSGVENIAEIDDRERVTIEWIENNIAIAERLLSDTQQLYGTLDQEDSYLTSCYAALEKLYGDIDEVIRLWEIANDRGPGTAVGRRALANAYFARNNRRWSSMQLSELQRIVELTELNLRSPGRREDDYRLWFESYKLLPEFDIDEAIGKLGLWASHFPSWRAYYYLYVLHFHLWFAGRSNSLNEMDDALDKCKKLHFGRRNISPQWLGYEPSHCPLIADADLGEWDKKSAFWENTSSLRRINGIIEDVSGRQAGSIKIDGKIKVFFVPARRKDTEGKSTFYQEKDENTPVNFFVGFSPEGLRAWSVERGWTEDGHRVPFGQVEPKLVPVTLPSPSISDQVKYERAQSLKLSRVLSFINDLVQVKTMLGADLTLTELEERLEAVFGIDGLVAELGFLNLHQLVQGQGKYQVVRSDGDMLITCPDAASLVPERKPRMAKRETVYGQIQMFHDVKNFGFVDDRWFSRDFILPGDRPKVTGKGQIVEYTPDKNDRGPIAVGIRILDDTFTLANGQLITPAELPAAVKASVERYLNEAMVGEKPLSLDELKQLLNREFKGAIPLEERLDVSTLTEFIAKIADVEITGDYGKRFVRFRQTRAFGRKATSAPAKPLVAKDQPQVDARTLAVRIVEEAEKQGKRLTLSGVSTKLHEQLPGTEKLAKRLGVAKVLDFISQIPQLEVHGDVKKDPDIRIRRKQPAPLPVKPALKPAAAPKPPAKAPAATVPIAGDKALIAKAKSLVVKLVAETEARGKPAQIVVVGKQVAQRLFQLPINVGVRLGYPSLLRFYADIPEIEVYKNMYGGKYLRTREAKTASIEKAPAPKINGKPPAPELEPKALLEAARAFVLELLKSAASQNEDLRVIVAGAKLGNKFPGQPGVSQRCGYRNFIEFLSDIPEIEVEGSEPLRYVRFKQTNGREPQESVKDQKEAPALVTQARDLAIALVRKAQAGDRKLRALSLASSLARKLPGEGSLAARLGYQTFDQFLKDIPSLRIEGIEPIRYVTLSSADEFDEGENAN